METRRKFTRQFNEEVVKLVSKQQVRIVADYAHQKPSLKNALSKAFYCS